jgi:hypothetical protein
MFRTNRFQIETSPSIQIGMGCHANPSSLAIHNKARTLAREHLRYIDSSCPRRWRRGKAIPHTYGRPGLIVSIHFAQLHQDWCWYFVKRSWNRTQFTSRSPSIFAHCASSYYLMVHLHIASSRSNTLFFTNSETCISIWSIYSDQKSFYTRKPSNFARFISCFPLNITTFVHHAFLMEDII